MQDTYTPAEPVESEMEAIGGETLDDSGFESERPDLEFDDPVEGSEE